jgi:hypothetical protein
MSANVSEEHITSIFGAENISWARNHLLTCWFLAQPIFSTLKMEAICCHSKDYTALYPRRWYSS